MTDKLFPMLISMMCPKCQISIVPREQARVQSLSEHICDPNGESTIKQLYGCLNRNCACFKDKIRWTVDGERYGGKYDIDYKFIDDNDAPFGTIFRKINAEQQSRLVFTLNLYFIKWRLLEQFKANEWGKISKYWKVETLVRQGRYFTYYHSGIHMLVYCIKKINWNCKQIKEVPNEPFFREQLKEGTESKSWWSKKDWWRWVAMWYAKFRLWSGEVRSRSWKEPKPKKLTAKIDEQVEK